MTDQASMGEGRVPGMTSADWASEGSRRWLAHADRLEAMLAPVDDVLLAAADLRPGAVVLDVGCGRGVTARSVAAAVGPAGHVTGIDISPTMIDEAAAAPVLSGSAPPSWIAADAATHDLPPERHDRVISRFGVMFFDDPVPAFANLRSTTRPEGRLVVAVWQPRDASEFQSLAIDVAMRVATERGHRFHTDPPDAGPFAYGSAAYVTRVLHQAGWVDIEFTPHELVLYLGGPGTTPDQAIEMGRTFGPLAALLGDAPPEVVDAVVEALRDELTIRWDGTGIPLEAAIAIVSARPG